jgi:hypothetical protein
MHTILNDLKNFVNSKRNFLKIANQSIEPFRLLNLSLSEHKNHTSFKKKETKHARPLSTLKKSLPFKPAVIHIQMGLLYIQIKYNKLFFKSHLQCLSLLVTEKAARAHGRGFDHTVKVYQSPYYIQKNQG